MVYSADTESVVAKESFFLIGLGLGSGLGPEQLEQLDTIKNHGETPIRRNESTHK